MATVTLTSIHKSYGKTAVIHGIDLAIAEGELIVIVGPSGCGKSTLLRMVAGLETITRGDLMIDGERLNDAEPMERNIAMVFQNYALYPHMSVADNMGYALKIAGKPKTEIAERVATAAQMLQLEPYLARRPRELSGGQRQRVAMGRAIVRKPAVFLFDEPLSNLDAKLRVQMRSEIKNLHKTLQTTMVYVTHDQTEAMTMGDRIAVMKEGVIHQLDTPLNVYHDPADKFVAGFIGSPAMNFLSGKIENNHIIIENGKFTLPIIDEHIELLKIYENQDITIGIRPESITLQKETDHSVEVNLQCDIVEPTGHEALIYLNTGETKMVCKTNEYDHETRKKDRL